MIKLKHKILLIMLLVLGIGAGNSWAQVLMNIQDLTAVVETNEAGTRYFANGQFSWTAGLRGNNNANVITVGSNKFVRLPAPNDNGGNYLNRLLTIQFATGKIKAGDHLVVDVARCTSDGNCDLGFFLIKQTMNNNVPSYTRPDLTSALLYYANTKDATRTYTIDYVIKEADINTINATTQNLVIGGFWYSSTAIHSIKIVRQSIEAIPEISVIAPTSKTLKLTKGQKYVFKAQAIGGVDQVGVIWRKFESATPEYAYDGEKLAQYTNSYEYEAPATPGTYYIGADAQHYNGGWQESDPYVITVNVVDDVLPKIEVTEPATNTITLGTGQSYTFKAQASEGENNERSVVWRTYTTATAANPSSGTKVTNAHSNTYAYTAPSTSGTYYIGANAQYQHSSGDYKESNPYIITVNVVGHTTPAISVSAPTTNSISLKPGETYVFKAEASGEGNPTVVWRQYNTASPAQTHSGKTLSYDDELTYTAPTTPGTHYIGADAWRACVDKSHSDHNSAPRVITVNVTHDVPTITVTAPASGVTTVDMLVGETYTFKAEASGGEGGAFVGWRRYRSATPKTADPGPEGSISGTDTYNGGIYEFKPTEAGTYYIGADALQVCKFEKNPDGTNKYENSLPYVITVNVRDNSVIGTENKNLSFAYNGETKTRQYRVYVPSSVLSQSTTEVPVVFSLHGAANSNELTDWGVQNFNSLADANKFIVVYPQGRKLIFPYFGNQTDGENGWESTGAINEDTEFFKAIIADLSSSTTRAEYKNNGSMRFTIDPSRIYITGFSNGGEMAYACANAMPEVFAAYSSISGLQMNEMHMQHHGSRPVPFIHIHGTKDDFIKYSHMPTVIDNMIFRNGNNMTPVNVTTGTASYWNDNITSNETSNFRKSEYTGGTYPYVYYEIGNGMTASDKGMGHSADCTIGGNNSKKIFWEFMSKYSLPANTTDPVEFSAKINTDNTDARAHGWQINNAGLSIAQYGESGGYTTAGQNVYHSLQLKNGVHYISFNVNGASTSNVTVRLTRLAPLSAFDRFREGSVTGEYTETLVLDKTYKIDQNNSICVKYDNSADVASEYTLTILKGAANDKTTISNVLISTNGTETPSTYEVIDRNTDFTGYVNYNTRLAAQWNFDICDQYRFVASQMNSNTWTADYGNTDGKDASTAKYGKVIYTYNKALGTSEDDTDTGTYSELTYNGTTVIPVAAGLKFKAEANKVKIQADLSNGVVTGIHLILEDGVKMYIPYVENTFRNDNDNASNPTKDNFGEFENCMHHHKRDILYIATADATNFLNLIINRCIDLTNQTLLGDANNEYVNGKTFRKTNYLGKNGTPCILQFRREAVIDRIGVNRNLTSSFYTQYIHEQGYTKPQPHMRVVGGLNGGRIANGVNDSWVYSDNAIVMTYGGWEDSEGSNSYTAFDGSPVTDQWSELTEGAGATSLAVGVFSVISQNNIAPTSEALMHETNTVYHPASNGKFNTSYVENYTPWTLPCRGGYLKFEPTIPGVLNVDVFQKGGNVYYIADEFGKLVSTSDVFCKITSTATMTKANNGFSTNVDSYVKYSFDVYPGKTYYMFSKEAGIGFAGYFFEPNVYRTNATDELARLDVELKKLTLTDGTNYAYPSSLDASYRTVKSPGTSGDVSYTIHSDNKAVEVTLNRSFKANTWSSICLPFSMNNNAMEKVFGKGTRVVLLRDVQDKEKMKSGKTTANFIAHEHQDIIAGYPYFIYPTLADMKEKDEEDNEVPMTEISSITTNAYIPATTASIPSISSQGFVTSAGSGNYGGLQDYNFTGSFSNVIAPQGSYYMSVNGKLSRCTKAEGVALKPYRAYMSFVGTYSAAKALDSVFYGNTDDNLKEGDATGIDEISIDDMLLMNGILTQSANVYNMQGQIVRQNVTNLQGLPKGAYIVNGKKYVIK